MTNLIVITVYNDVMSHIVAGESEVIATSKTQALVVPLLLHSSGGLGVEVFLQYLHHYLVMLKQ